MRHGVVLVLGFLGLGAAPAPPVPAHQSAFEAFKLLAGTWHGQGHTPEAGAFQDVYCFEIAAGGRFVRAEYRMEGGGGESLWHDFGAYGIDPLTGEMFSVGFGSDGATAGGRLQVYREGLWVFEGRTDGSTVFARYRFAVRRLDEDHLFVSVEVPGDTAWKMLYAARYTRERT